MINSKMMAVLGGAPTDPQFNYVTMLLHGDGTNGAQNNTFLDSSSNNFTITRNGNTTQGTFSPYGANWSNWFDGAGDYLSIADANALDFAGDFTVEAWVFVPTTSGNARTIVHKADTNVGYALVLIPSGYIEVQCTSLQFNSSTVLPLNQWNHVAMVRNGSGTNNVKFYLNGVLDGQGTNTSDTASSVTLGVGAVARSGAAGVNPLNGYISNVRLNSSAVYTSAFTPSTVPLTAISGTSFLTCQSNRFIDNSANNFTITRNGDVSVQRFSPFAPTAAYSTSVIGGSGYFDGSGDYLRTSSGSTSLGTNNFTMECWVYPTTSGDQIVFDCRSGSNSNKPTLGVISLQLAYQTSGVNRIVGGSTPLNTWSHLAIVRNSNVIYAYINGVQVGTYSDSSDYGTVTRYQLGADDDGGPNAYFGGYVSDSRFVTSAVYTSAFTPPTAPLTAITNTSLLCNYTNAGIFDNAMMNDLETVGNVQISTSVKKYGTGSIYFDGTGDWLSVPNNNILNMGAGDFTIECWVNRTATTSSPNSADVFFGKGSNNLVLSINISTGKFEVANYGVANLLTSTTVVSNGTWYHFAVTRSGTTLRLFINGSLEASTTSSANFSSSTNLFIGADPSNTNQRLYGYIDDLRITKGYARYTANFTPPAQAFPNN